MEALNLKHEIRNEENEPLMNSKNEMEEYEEAEEKVISQWGRGRVEALNLKFEIRNGRM